MYWLSKKENHQGIYPDGFDYNFKSVHPIDYYIVGGNIPQSTDFYRNTF